MEKCIHKTQSDRNPRQVEHETMYCTNCNGFAPDCLYYSIQQEVPKESRVQKCKLKEMIENQPSLVTQEDMDECLYDCDGFDTKCKSYVPKHL